MSELWKRAIKYCSKDEHITVRGRGVFSTSIEHIISTDNAKKAAVAAESIRSNVKRQA